MKKILKIYLYFSIFCFMCLSYTMVKADEWDNETYLDTDLQRYYYNLDTYVVHNDTNTFCTLEAFGKLLSYYDNFYDEYFIFNNHYQGINLDFKIELNYLCEYKNKTSPGVRYISRFPYFESDNPSSTVDTAKFTEFCQSVYDYHFFNNSSFLGYLLKIDYYENIVNYGQITSGLTSEESFELYNKYFEILSNQTSLNIENYQFIYKTDGYDSNKSNQYRNEVIQYIRNGYPVICNFKISDNNYHSCVCYDYNEISDSIFCNTDVLENGVITLKNHYNTDLFVTNGQVYLDSYYVIVPNNSYIHTCTGAYYIELESSNFEYYCVCELQTVFHNFVSNSLNHICSDCEFEEYHDFRYVKKNSLSHIKQCKICNYELTEPHCMEIHNTYSICSLCRYRTNTTDIPIVSIKKEEEDE